MGDHNSRDDGAEFLARNTDTVKNEANLAKDGLLQCAFDSQNVPYSEIRENGVWKASQFVEQDGTMLTNLYKDGTIYFERQELDKNPVLKKREDNSPDGAWIDVKPGSKEYNNVSNEINHLNFRNLPKCPDSSTSPVDKGYQEPSSEDLKKATQQIEQEKKPLVALRYTDQSDIFAHRGELEELVYEYGKLSAARYLTPHQDIQFSVYIGNDAKQYSDRIDDNGKDNVSRVLRDAQGFNHEIPVSDASPEYKAVTEKVHSIDWDHVPNFVFKK